MGIFGDSYNNSNLIMNTTESFTPIYQNLGLERQNQLQPHQMHLEKYPSPPSY